MGNMRRVAQKGRLQRSGASWCLVLLLVGLLLPICTLPAAAARLAEFLPRVTPAEIFPGADRIGPPPA